MEQRKCKQCGFVGNIIEFAKAGIVNDKMYYRHFCKKCYYERKIPRLKDIRKWFRGYKETLKCKHCGNSDHRVLEFHHISNKNFTISNAVVRGYAKEKILEEISKCIVLCANCHRIVHYTENVV